MKLNLYQVTAFPKSKQGGNKAGVVIDADWMNEFDMQQVAFRVGFSETAFVLKSDVADFKLRFFTPTNEVDLCGHATIATFNLLRDLGHITVGKYTQETKAGILDIDVCESDVFMEQNNPKYFEFVDPKEVEQCFDEDNFVASGLPVRVLSTGVKEIFLPVKSVDLLHSLTPNFTNIIALSKEYGVIGIHAFALAEDCDAYSRNFAPIVGINEESATGTSNGALGCYLNNYVTTDKTDFVLRQGYSMGMPSEIICTIKKDNDSIVQVLVGGTAVML